MPLRITMAIPADEQAIEAAVEGLTAMNYRMMHAANVGGGGFPSLYASGIVYRREPPGQDEWVHAVDLLRKKEGDCEDVAAYRAAELRLAGEPATVKILRTKRNSYHAVVQRATGEIEDPSRILLRLEASKQRG